MLNDNQKKEVTELLSDLIKAQSYSGQENLVVAIIKDYMSKNGFDDIVIDRYGSIIGVIKGQRPGPVVLYDGHIDTVPVPDPEKWTHNPFGAEIAGGKLYGRGTSDMKGAVAAMVCAASEFKKATGGDFAGSLCVAGVVHEECFEGIAAREISRRFNPDYVIIGEASELNLKIGQRGRAEVVVETFGLPAHSANPDKGINAVHLMMRLIEAIDKLAPTGHPSLGLGVNVLTDIISSPYPGASVVPSHCRATYDRRLLVGENPEGVLAPLKEAVRILSEADPKFKASVSLATGKEKCHTGDTIEGQRFFPGWLFDQNEPFIQKALSALKDIGLSPQLAHYSFCTNGSHYAGEKNIKTFGFGPSRENLAHTIDEHIELDQLFSATAGYQAISQALLSA
ncbi:MAG: YgeY family selenium metabolism-linked hydrolase [Deltaproteobacteria bacterium]|jgi:putative selenium metabolism hydrolase|nr:YgeY family selenium metabolism-linked hydrolase [Deltaproteobacteria bacterium]